MVIGKITDGNMEILKDYGVYFELIEDGNDYLIAMTICNENEEDGLVITINAEDYDGFKESLMLVRSQINKRIVQKRRLNKALEHEFKE